MAGLFRRITEKLFSSKTTPKQTSTQARHVRDKVYDGDTKAMAADYGVTPRTVLRWIDGTRKKLPKETAARLEEQATAAQVTDRGRERKAKEMEAAGHGAVRIRVDRAHDFKIRRSDAMRARAIDLYLTPEQAAELARAEDELGAHDAVEGALLDYFNGGAYVGFQRGDLGFSNDDVEIL
ncbi:hypothetical protein AB0C76_32870 [Kitasatospora sp. NPDC048722]|uniref:hypothetical protein n=1 Tax=Kitasatospora sp. NPDC048722 TaxID=3155639 RepID=UPI0034118982